MMRRKIRNGRPYIRKVMKINKSWSYYKGADTWANDIYNALLIIDNLQTITPNRLTAN